MLKIEFHRRCSISYLSPITMAREILFFGYLLIVSTQVFFIIRFYLPFVFGPKSKGKDIVGEPVSIIISARNEASYFVDILPRIGRGKHANDSQQCQIASCIDVITHFWGGQMKPNTEPERDECAKAE